MSLYYDFFQNSDYVSEHPMMASILYIVFVIELWGVFEKANVPGWHAIIPILNIYDLFKIGWGHGWFFLLLIIPVVNVFVYLYANYKLAKKFTHGFLFSLGISIFPHLFYFILAFGDSKYYDHIA